MKPLHHASGLPLAPTAQTGSATGLHAFFRPQHVAVIGASATPGKLGHSVVRNLVRGGFAGRISAINPAAAEVEGQAGYACMADIGGPVDCAFVAIPAARVLDAVRDCAAARVRTMVIGVSGFAELGTDAGRALQQAVAGQAAAAGMRVIGPNTNGLLDTHARLSLGYNASHAERFRSGPVSILSHSGALFDGIAKRLHGYGAGLAKFVAVGNELDVSMLDLLEFLVEDADTQVIGLVIEGLADGLRLRTLANRLAVTGKRVVVLKIGRSAEGAGAALAHSSRMAGSSRAWDALLKACGFASVRTVEALAGACAVLASNHPRDEAQRLLCITTSGAGGAILADFASDHGMELAPQWDAGTAKAMTALPTAAAIRNPIDMGSLGDWGLLTPALERLEAAGYKGPVAVYAHVAPGPGMGRQLVDALLARRKRVQQPLVLLTPGGLVAEDESRLTEAGIPVFHDAVTCFDSLAAHYADARPFGLPADQAADTTPGVALLLDGEAPGSVLSEWQSSALLREAGVPMVPSAVAHDMAQALEEATRMGFPVVLKAMVPGIAHKHQAGLVGIGLHDATALEAEFARQQGRIAALGAANHAFWLLQPMLRGKLELIAGVTHEPGLGHFLVFGIGGVHTEIWDQIDLIPVPVAQGDLGACVAASRTSRLLNALEPSGAARQSLVDTLASLQTLVQRHGSLIGSIDVNPLLLSGTSLVAVDALVVMSGRA